MASFSSGTALTARRFKPAQARTWESFKAARMFPTTCADATPRSA